MSELWLLLVHVGARLWRNGGRGYACTYYCMSNCESWMGVVQSKARSSSAWSIEVCRFIMELAQWVLKCYQYNIGVSVASKLRKSGAAMAAPAAALPTPLHNRGQYENERHNSIAARKNRTVCRPIVSSVVGTGRGWLWIVGHAFHQCHLRNIPERVQQRSVKGVTGADEHNYYRRWLWSKSIQDCITGWFCYPIFHWEYRHIGRHREQDYMIVWQKKKCCKCINNSCTLWVPNAGTTNKSP